MKFAVRFILGILASAMVLAPAARAADGAGDSTAPTPPAPRIEIVEFRDAPLREALSVIGQASGLNLAASDEAAKTRVNIRLRNISANGAVQAICQTHGLFFNRKNSQDGIDIVTTVKEFQDGLTVFREEKTEVYTLLYPNAVDLAVSIRDLFGTRVQFNQNSDDGTDEISQRFSRFDIFDGRSQGLGVGGTANGSTGGQSSGGGGGSSGGGSSSSRGGGSRSGNFGQPVNDNSAQRQDDRRNYNRAELDYLASLTENATANARKGVGIDADKLANLGRASTSPIYVSVLNRTNQVIVRTSDQAVLEEINRLKCKIDVPTPQVLLEMKVLSVDLSGGFNSVFDAQFGDTHNASSFSTGDILPAPRVPTSILDTVTNQPPSLNIGGNSSASGPPYSLNPSSLIYQFVNDNFRVRMQMLNTSNRVTTLATPLLLVANNEVSRVFVGQNRPIVSNISSSTTATQGVITNTPQTTITFQAVGTTLLVTPTINSDRTVTLRLVQETSSVITGGATIPVIAGNGNVTNQPVDVVAAQTLSGTLVAKDGLSLALGGLVEEGVNDSRQTVPILGQIPVIGVAFRRQVTGRFRREVIIVIRPYILSTPGEAEEVGKRLTDANSIHPKAPELTPEPNEPIGALNTYLPREALRANPPKNKLEDVFRFHTTLPSDF